MEVRTAGCPLGAKCEEIRDDIKYVCPWYTQIRGADPQSGADIDEWRCAIAWIPVLTIEGAQQGRQTGAAVESFRNEMSKQNNQLAAIMLHASGGAKLIEGDTNAENERTISDGAGGGQD